MIYRLAYGEYGKDLYAITSNNIDRFTIVSCKVIITVQEITYVK